MNFAGFSCQVCGAEDYVSIS